MHKPSYGMNIKSDKIQTWEANSLNFWFPLTILKNGIYGFLWHIFVEFNFYS